MRDSVGSEIGVILIDIESSECCVIFLVDVLLLAAEMTFACCN